MRQLLIAGAIVAGPIRAGAGGAIGAWVGGPRWSRRDQECWYARNAGTIAADIVIAVGANLAG